MEPSETLTPPVVEGYTHYLSILDTANPNSTPLFVSLLKLNTVLIENLTDQFYSYRQSLFTFAWRLYQGDNDQQVAYALLFICQFVKQYKVDNLVNRLYINIIHLYNNAYLSVVYRASQLLSDRLLAMDATAQNKLSRRIYMNLQMNDHIIDQQIHIWRLIIQLPEFFYPSGDHLFFQIFSSSKSLILRSGQYRELMIDIISLVASYYYRKQRDSTQKKVDNDMQRTINLHMMITVCRVLQVSVSSPQDQLLFRRSCELAKTILQLTPMQPLSLDDMDRSTPNLDAAMKKLSERSGVQTEEQLYKMIMPLIVSFRISAMSLPLFRNAYLEMNAENLKKKICIVLEYMDRGYIYGSLLELIPGEFGFSASRIELFACSQPYSPNVLRLLNAIRDSLLSIFNHDLELIPPSSPRQTTRLWRVVYLMKAITDRSAASFPLFMTYLVRCCEQLHSLYRMILEDARKAPYLSYHETEPVTMFVSGGTLTCRQDGGIELGTPPVPVLHSCELLYSLQLLLELLVNNIQQLGDHTKFITFIAAACVSFLQRGQRGDLLAFTLDLFTHLLEREEDILSLREIMTLFKGVRELYLAQETVLYERLVTAHWRFMYTVCKRYVGLGKRVERQHNRPATTAEEVQMKKMMEVMVFGGMTVVNPEVRKLFRPFFLEILPSVLSKQFLRFLNEVGEGKCVERSRRRGSIGVSGCLCSTSCCCVRLT